MPGLCNRRGMPALITQTDDGEGTIERLRGGAADERQPLIQTDIGQKAFAYHVGERSLVTMQAGFPALHAALQFHAAFHQQRHNPDRGHGEGAVGPHAANRNAFVWHQGGAQQGHDGGQRCGGNQRARAETAGQGDDGGIANAIQNAARVCDVDDEKRAAGKDDACGHGRIAQPLHGQVGAPFCRRGPGCHPLLSRPFCESYHTAVWMARAPLPRMCSRSDRKVAMLTGAVWALAAPDRTA